ncbi:hypothetical protein WDU94_015244, partial [Cyamophila willieti]
RCNAVSDPSLKLTIEWVRGNEAIDFESEPRYVQSNDYSLTVTKTSELDSGVYTCRAKTDLDFTEAQATLTVQDVPNSPRLQKVQCNKRDASIQWVPMGDNRAPILRYTIEYNTSFTPDTWETAFDAVPATDMTYTVPMSPWANFTFRVIAINKIGKSLPSSHSTVCTTLPDVPFKNPDNVEGRGSTPSNLVISWTVLAYNGAYNGPPSETIAFVTPEGVPGTVQSLEAVPLGASAFYLKWVKPEQPNGVLMGYKIKYQSVKGTKVGPLLERLPYIADPSRTTAKLAGLEPATKYRIHIAGYTKAGDGADYFIETKTRGTDTIAPAKPNFKLVNSGSENGYGAFKVLWEPNTDHPGSHFFVKYSFHFSDGVSVMPYDTVATAGWFIGMLLAIAFLILVLILVCLIKRNRGGKYAVHEREAAHGRHDYPEEPGFNEYSQPLDGKPRTRSSMSSEKHPVESDTDSMAEYGDGDTAQFTEDGSFIGLYAGGKKKPLSPTIVPPPLPQPMSAIATYV